MKLIFTGKAEQFLPHQQEKLDARLKKLAQTIERNGEREARAAVKKERYLHKVEVTLNAFDHAMAGEGADRDLFIALNQALDKLEKQVLKIGAKWRATKRHKEASGPIAQKTVPAPVKALPKRKTARAEVFRVNHREGSKPMTLDEAMLAMEESDTYFSYTDAGTQRVCVLLRRKDGHFDLVEG